MSLTYADIGAHIFGEKEFSSAEFSRRTGNPRSAKVLSELAIRGVVSRRARGRYKFLRPSERPDLRAGEWEHMREILLRGPEPKAWDGPTAVEVWTGGRYLVSPSLYSRVFYLAVPKEKLPAWKGYLAHRGISLNGRKRVGARVVIREATPFRRTIVAGEPVVSKETVVATIRASPGVYAEAEALLIDRPSSA